MDILTWTFAEDDSDASGFEAPVPLAAAITTAPRGPGVYVVSCGSCLAHVGTSKNLRARLQVLARLGHHRGSAEVLCAAFCTRCEPLVRWSPAHSDVAARVVERRLKTRYGEPPAPRGEHSGCRNGLALRQALTDAAGPESWEAGYIEAVFKVGEDLRLLEADRFRRIWRLIGRPPGPWESRLGGDD